ncbi:hypothetical protein Rai3103_14605 [Raineyella fluvialis]|uniref:Uncharacterized protein n=1 Tax=Raineyella fluvialis TaxID=2662261 RepID=A0A5Q2FCY0_9ACTN|nr:hypothetical protein Rai3103_14605 [Raineyella fluvialis]
MSPAATLSPVLTTCTTRTGVTVAPALVPMAVPEAESAEGLAAVVGAVDPVDGPAPAEGMVGAPARTGGSAGATTLTTPTSTVPAKVGAGDVHAARRGASAPTSPARTPVLTTGQASSRPEVSARGTLISDGTLDP